MWIQNNEIVIKTPRSITKDGVTYPSAVFKDTELLTSLGITSYREEKVDDKYYWQGQLTITNGVGTYEAIPRDVDTLKEGMLNKVNEQLMSRQSNIDWLWSRASKGRKPVPQNMKDYAATLYVEQDDKEAEINALITLADIIAYENKPFTEVRKIKHTSDTGVETYGPETESSDRNINMTMHWTANPMDEVDPSFVSLVPK